MKKKESSGWKAHYIANQNGKVFKISELSDSRINGHIGNLHQKVKTIKIHLDMLYEQRAIRAGEPVEEGKSIRKIKNILKIKEPTANNDEAKRMRSIVLLALKYLEEGKDNSLIIALLEQARNEV
jgi:hypothetical protein